jgi:hypothetical protein
LVFFFFMRWIESPKDNLEARLARIVDDRREDSAGQNGRVAVNSAPGRLPGSSKCKSGRNGASEKCSRGIVPDCGTANDGLKATGLLWPSTSYGTSYGTSQAHLMSDFSPTLRISGGPA